MYFPRGQDDRGYREAGTFEGDTDILRVQGGHVFIGDEEHMPRVRPGIQPLPQAVPDALSDIDRICARGRTNIQALDHQ